MFPEPNITRPYELLTHVNTITDGFFGTIILTGIFLVAMLGMLSKQGDFPKAFAGSAFITLILCILLFIVGIVPIQTFYMFLGLAIVGMGVVWIKQ